MYVYVNKKWTRIATTKSFVSVKTKKKKYTETLCVGSEVFKTDFLFCMRVFM